MLELKSNRKKYLLSCFVLVLLLSTSFIYSNQSIMTNAVSTEIINYDTSISFFPSTAFDIIIHNPYSDVDFETMNHYKANLHTHTTESDGSSSPSEVIYHYHESGEYNILAITDHNKNTWPWNEWITEKPLEQTKSSEYYPKLNMLAVSGNEMSIGHHRGSLLNQYPYGGKFITFTFWFIDKLHGLSLFYHPGRYNYNIKWYQDYFDTFNDCIIGIEVYNQGDRYPNDRNLWDSINKERDPDDFIWGFSNDDMHHISKHSFRNYQHILMDDLGEEEFRKAITQGSFYFSYEPKGSDTNDPFYGQAMTPKLLDVDIKDGIIQVIGDNVENIQWYDEDSQIINTNNSIDISLIDTNFVRAVLINEYGRTYTQPFGITKS